MKYSALTPYFNFSAERFCKDYNFKMALLKSFREQLEDLTGEKGVEIKTDRVQSSPESDQIEKLVIMRINLEEKIQDIENYFEIYNSVMAVLDPDEKMAIDFFFNMSWDSERAVAEMAEFGISRSAAYRLRESALNKIKSFLAG